MIRNGGTLRNLRGSDGVSLKKIPNDKLNNPFSMNPQTSIIENPTTTPMLKQYQEIKAKHKDCILFFRLGDFYEMFYDDAKIASNVLDLVLTSRSNGKSAKIPMCGIPYHAADSYIAKLIKAGLKVAICEQVEDPSLAEGTIVKRDVIRTITSGTFLDETSSEARYLLSLTPHPQGFGLAFFESNSGAIQTNQYTDERSEHKIREIISKLPVYECIFPYSHQDRIKEILRHPILRLKNMTLSPFDDWSFNPEIARKTLGEHFRLHNLNGFGIEDYPLAQASCGALLEYLKAMNKQPLRHIDKISLYTDVDYVFISPAACYGLELENLLKTLDHTLTSLGKRKLRSWLYHPLKNRAAIEERQRAIHLLKEAPQIRQELERLLRHLPDIEKNISRLSYGYFAAKDFLSLRNALNRLPEIQKAISSLSAANPLFTLKDIADLRELLNRAINPDISLSHSEGKIIQKNFHPELDSLREIQEHGQKWLQDLQLQEIKRTGIHSLKIGYNQVFGYYIEITKSHLNAVPADYIRKQTLVNGERFITTALKEFEEKILTAEEKILKIENELLHKIRQEILDHCVLLHEYASQLAVLDVLFSLSVLAQSSNYIVPRIVDTTKIDLRAGRHPVVEKTLPGSFVANDTLLDCDENHLIILTGPNMAGKSTYIRQIAVLVILAQMGSYIPAESAEIGIVDKIFTRIGAHDDITKGQSTFMVEMNETADILNNLSQRSLVILDEIGRGTSTYDGLSLAWALAEHLHRQKARTLFATHFHELTALADEFPGVKNYNVAVKEWKDEIIFLHKIIPGSTDDSYGIYVAKLAGIPPEVISRSRQILTQLELQNNLKEKIRFNPSGEKQLSLFANNTGISTMGGCPAGDSLGAGQPPAIGADPDPLMLKIQSIIESMDINSLTPLAALNKLQELKEIVARPPQSL